MSAVVKYPRFVCWTPDACEKAYKFLSTCVLIAHDIETIPFKKKNKTKQIAITVLAYSGITDSGEIRSFAFPFQNGKSILSGTPTHFQTIYLTCQRINDLNIRFTGHNFTYDLAWLIRYLLPVRNYAYDSMTMWWSLYPELPKTLDFVSSILLDHYQYWKAQRKSEDFIEYMHYAMSDTESTLLNTLYLIRLLKVNPRATRNFTDAHNRCVIGLGMSLKGLKVDQQQMDSYEAELKAKAEEKLADLRFITSRPDFNPNSPPQKKELLYTILGARLRGPKGKFVKKFEEASTGAMVLRAVRSEHPIFRRVINAIIDAQEPAKQISNVVGLVMMEKANRAPRFLTSYDGVGTTTTRYGSRTSAFGFGGNAQNIRKDYRPFGVADDDSFYLEVDFSAADDVFVSFESQEQKKIDLVRSGKDIHATNALIFFPNWTYEEIVRLKKAKDSRIVHPITGIRQITKKLVHGNHYLMAALTLLMSAGREAIVAAAKELGFDDAGYWTQHELTQFCDSLEHKFRSYYPRFKRSGSDSWYTDLKLEVDRNGGFTTCFNYYQRFLSSTKDDSTIRAIAATAGQANTAGRVNMALDEMILGKRLLRFRDGPAPDLDDLEICQVSEFSHGVSLRQQTHDSAGFNIHYTHPNWQDGVRRIFKAMRRPVLCKGEVFSVGIEADVSYAWAGKESRTVESVEDIEKFLMEVPRAA